MKRILCLLLALLFTLIMSTSVFAASDNDNIDDPLVPTSPEIVTQEMYGEFPDEEIPEGAPPLADPSMVLPKTGGIPPEVFYAAGGVCIVSAVVVLGVKRKTSEK